MRFLGAGGKMGFGGRRKWTPSEITDGNLRQWYRADGEIYDASSGGNKVSVDDATVRRWEDESGTLSSHPVSSTDTDSPKYKTNVLNGLPVVRFSGVRGLFRSATPVFANNPSSMSFFCLFRDDNSAAGNKGVFDIDNYEPIISSTGSPNYRPWAYFISLGVVDYSTLSYSTFNSTRNSWQITSYVLDFPNDSIFFQRNGGTATYSMTRDFNANTYGSVNKNVMIGGRFVETVEVLIGDIAEIIAITNDTSIETRQKIEGYLAHKWGLTSNLPNDHPYKSNPPTV